MVIARVLIFEKDLSEKLERQFFDPSRGGASHPNDRRARGLSSRHGKAGLTHPMMTDIEQKLGVSP